MGERPLGEIVGELKAWLRPSGRVHFLSEHEAGKREVVESIRDWLRSSPRKPAELAFSAGPERELAAEIETALRKEQDG